MAEELVTEAAHRPVRAAGVSRPRRGQLANGDAFLLRACAPGDDRSRTVGSGDEGAGRAFLDRRADERLLLAVVDGTGHGPQAAASTQRIVERLRTCPLDDLQRLFDACHEAARGGRGGAVGMALLDPAAGTVELAAVGSIQMQLASTSSDGFEGVALSGGLVGGRVTRRVASTPGIVGYRMPRSVLRTRLPYRAGDVLAIWSDGCELSMDADTLRMASVRADGAVQALMGEMPSGDDDATLVILGGASDCSEACDGLEARYRQRLNEYLREPSEDTFYRVSLLSKEFVRSGMGPAELVAMHGAVMASLLQAAAGQPRRAARIIESGQEVLLEAMVVFASYHQEIRQVVGQLERRCAELDDTRHALERSRDELRDRTAQLVHTGKMGALGELAAATAHEVSQPLNAIKITCQDVARGIKRARLQPDDVLESMDDVVQAVERLSEILDGLRRYSRRDRDASRQICDLRPAVQRILKLVQPQLRRLDIELEQELDDELQVCGNVGQLEQVIMNFLSNARDAVMAAQARGARRIAVRGHHEAGDGRLEVVIEVVDSGVGIASEHRAEIFEPFFTTKEGALGTGLGLSVSKEIAEAHGGRIEADSEPGVGTTFRLRLPAA